MEYTWHLFGYVLVIDSESQSELEVESKVELVSESELEPKAELGFELELESQFELEVGIELEVADVSLHPLKVHSQGQPNGYQDHSVQGHTPDTTSNRKNLVQGWSQHN